MFSDERLRAAGIDPESNDYKYFKGRCDALGIDEFTPPLVAKAKLARMFEEATPEAVEEDDESWMEAEPTEIERRKTLTANHGPIVKDTKQQYAGFFTNKQQRRRYRK